jgi:hypothetical protein
MMVGDNRAVEKKKSQSFGVVSEGLASGISMKSSSGIFRALAILAQTLKDGNLPFSMAYMVAGVLSINLANLVVDNPIASLFVFTSFVNPGTFIGTPNALISLIHSSVVGFLFSFSIKLMVKPLAPINFANLFFDNPRALLIFSNFLPKRMFIMLHYIRYFLINKLMGSVHFLLNLLYYIKVIKFEHIYSHISAYLLNIKQTMIINYYFII